MAKKSTEKLDISFSEEDEKVTGTSESNQNAVKENSIIDSEVVVLRQIVSDNKKEIVELEHFIQKQKVEIKELSEKLENLRVNPIGKKEQTISDLFDSLYIKLKDERVVTLLEIARENILRFKNNSLTESEKQKLQTLFSEKVEGKISAARKISKK